MKLALRSLLAVLAAALAFACADAGSGAGAEPRGASLGRQREVERGHEAPSSPARLLLRGGGLVLDGPHRRSGAPPRLSAGTDPSHDTHFAALSLVRQAAGTRARGILSLALRRHLGAARDGTLSSHSNGVPPPPIA